MKSHCKLTLRVKAATGDAVPVLSLNIFRRERMHTTIDFTQHKFVDEPAEFLPADPHDTAQVRMTLLTLAEKQNLRDRQRQRLLDSQEAYLDLSRDQAA
jgi:hypothetical protein